MVMKAIIKTNVLNLAGTLHKVAKIENGFIFINVPFLNDFILLSFLPDQIELLD